MKSVWMLLAGVLLLVQTGVAEFRIENVRAEPVLPWGKVAVSYDVTGTLPEDADTYAAWISVSNRTAGSVQTVESLFGDMVLRLGHHWIVGDCEADGVTLAPGMFSFGVGYESSMETAMGWSPAVEVATPPLAEGAQVASGVPFTYSPLGTGTAKVSVDGTEILSRTAAGTGVWQPTATGRHVLAHTAGTNTWSRTVDVFSNLRVVNVCATPVAPWGRIVVDYTVAGTLPTNVTDYVAVVTASNRATGFVYAGGAAEGETALTLGKHRVWWDACVAELREASEVVDVKVSYLHQKYADSIVNSIMRYCVIDLSGGPTAVNYPVSYLSDIPSGNWTYKYKTTKLVLRRIPAGTFIMGSDQANESRRVTLTKPFYMGVFEVTQRQWELVMGYSSSSSYGRGDAYPAYSVSYNDIRGSSSGAQWPASSAVDVSSFLGRLRAKTGLEFDLPTEAQWEYACRAGTATKYYWGDAMYRAYVWYRDNSDFKTHPVGTGTPNAWGLYDMSGNVWEWCRDWYGTLAYGADPVGSASGSYRVRRGGSWYDNSDNCASSYRDFSDPSSRGVHHGFRLVRVLSD